MGKMKKPRVGQEWPVWWETNDGREAGKHKARILRVEPYTGRYPEYFEYVLTLHTPNNRSGVSEMAVGRLT